MTSCLDLPSDASAVIKQAATWRLASLLFECPAADWSEQVASLARETTDPTLVRAAESARREAAPELYHSTFGPGGPAAPREVSYRRGVLPGAALAELCDLYAAFGYRPSVDEPPDHIAVETGFVAYLRFKQAYALANGDQPHAEFCDEIARDFIREHVARVAGPLADALAASGITYLAATAEVLRSLAGPASSEISLPILNGETDEDE